MEDVTLTFDPSIFIKGLESINSGIKGMSNNFNSFAKNSNNRTQKVTAGIGSMIKGMALFKGVTGLVSKAMNQIPELGRTFSIAGDIMMRNFLWPLRKLLVPMLQKFLDWVRDNRAMFVRWGQVVANVFRIIVSIVKGFIRLLKRLWDRIALGIERVFGKTTKKVSDITNIILFKLAAMAEFIMMTLEPVFDFIGDAFEQMLRAGKGFFEGFTTGIGDLMPELSGLKESFGSLLDIFGKIENKSNYLVAIFKTLGLVIGTIVGGAIRTVVTIIDFLISKLGILIKSIQAFNAFRKGDLLTQRKLHAEITVLNDKFDKRLQERWKRQMEALRETRKEFGKTWEFVDKKTKKMDSPQRQKEVKEFIGTSSAPVIGQNAKGQVVNNRSRVQNINRGRTKNTTTNNTINMPITIKESKRPEDTANVVGRKVKSILQEEKYRTGGK